MGSDIIQFVQKQEKDNWNIFTMNDETKKEIFDIFRREIHTNYSKPSIGITFEKLTKEMKIRLGKNGAYNPEDDSYTIGGIVIQSIK